MTDLEFLQNQKAYALKWLAIPESELPGLLTYAKLATLLDETEDALTDHLGITLDSKGEFATVYTD